MLSSNWKEKVFKAIQAERSPIYSDFRVGEEKESPLDLSWFATPEVRARMKERRISCPYLVPKELWSNLRYYQQAKEDVKKKQDPQYFKGLMNTYMSKMETPHLGLYWSVSQKQYLPMIYTINLMDGQPRFFLTTQRGAELHLKPEEICALNV
jgi:hypothetical protein